MVPSKIDSPIWGMITSVGMGISPRCGAPFGKLREVSGMRPLQLDYKLRRIRQLNLRVPHPRRVYFFASHPERRLARSLRQTESKDLRLLFIAGSPSLRL
jgi:hypothetical protein